MAGHKSHNRFVTRPLEGGKFSTQFLGEGEALIDLAALLDIKILLKGSLIHFKMK